MAVKPLTLRELNRATLARQLLLERVALDVSTAVHRLGALQGQRPRAPYVAQVVVAEEEGRRDAGGDAVRQAAKGANAYLEREAEIALTVLEPAATRFEVEYVR